MYFPYRNKEELIECMFCALSNLYFELLNCMNLLIKDVCSESIKTNEIFTKTELNYK